MKTIFCRVLLCSLFLMPVAAVYVASHTAAKVAAASLEKQQRERDEAAKAKAKAKKP